MGAALDPAARGPLFFNPAGRPQNAISLYGPNMKLHTLGSRWPLPHSVPLCASCMDPGLAYAFSAQVGPGARTFHHEILGPGARTFHYKIPGHGVPSLSFLVLNKELRSLLLNEPSIMSLSFLLF